MKDRPKNRTPLRVAIVGAGKVGTVLGRVLMEEGARITAVVSRSRSSARTAASYLRCRTYADALTAIPSATDIVFITTPHDAVGPVAETLSRLEGLEYGRMGACHASGMLSAAVLEPLGQRGMAVFSFHPLQTFPRSFAPRKIVPTARGIWYAADGSPRGLHMAARLSRALRGHVIQVPPEFRELYHASCVVASNHLTVLLSALREMYGSVAGKEAVSLEPFRPILEATIHNVLATSPREALSGPVARGGVDTVAKHLRAVSVSVPALLPYFTRMTLETARLASEKGTLSAERRKAMEELINPYMQDSSLPGKRT
ncbi:MAG TPA: DUF2520 domain-containing protein [Bacteroidota bacterium]|nr:DUF2520 domain-containing protein [Bacteroidota bacterium]